MAKETSSAGILEKLVPVLLLASVILAFVVGMLWQKVSSLEKGGTTNTPAATNTQAGNAPPAPQVTIDQIKGLFAKNVVKFGDEKSKLIVVEVADPSCPWCHVAGGVDTELYAQMGLPSSYNAPVPELKKLVDAGKASFVYVYFPGHGNGEMGMKSLYCANEKGKFWQAHDLIMSNAGYNLLNNDVKNDKTKSQKLADFLKNVVNPTEMKSCLDSGKYDSYLTEDTQLAQSLGVTGTPSFFLNTTNFPGAVAYDNMKSAVDSALK